MSDSSSKSFKFSTALQAIVDNPPEVARGILEEKAPGLLRVREFVVAANFIVAKQISAELFGETLSPEQLAGLDGDVLFEIQSRVRPIMLSVFDERILEKTLGYRR